MPHIVREPSELMLRRLVYGVVLVDSTPQKLRNMLGTAYVPCASYWAWMDRVGLKRLVGKGLL